MPALPIFGLHAIPIPFFHNPVTAGFPSPAQDSKEVSLDFQRLLVRRPASTFSIRAQGNSMYPTIEDGDYLVVDRAIEARHDDIVIVGREGSFTVKRLFQKEGLRSLVPDNPDYSAMDLTSGSDVEIWGVVSRVVRVTCTR